MLLFLRAAPSVALAGQAAAVHEDHILDQLAKFKLPKRVLFVDELPRNTMGGPEEPAPRKVQRSLPRLIAPPLERADGLQRRWLRDRECATAPPWLRWRSPCRKDSHSKPRNSLSGVTSTWPAPFPAQRRLKSQIALASQRTSSMRAPVAARMWSGHGIADFIATPPCEQEGRAAEVPDESHHSEAARRLSGERRGRAVQPRSEGPDRVPPLRNRQDRTRPSIPSS